MRQFFSKLFSSPDLSDFSRLETDMHSHLLPGIDDGVPDMAEAVEMVRALNALGYKRIITTPHIMSERYPNTAADIKAKATALKEAVQKAEIPMEIHAAAEYFMDDHFGALMDKEELLTLDAERHVLVEVSFLHAPLAMEKYLFELQTKGYIPVLAHPERYPYYHNKLNEYKALKDAGCCFQLNILSITGHYGPDVQQAAQLLLKHKMVDYLGTDAHRMRHVQTLRAALRSGHLEKTLTKYAFANTRIGKPES
ncbi:MAG: histidinol phosphatase [Bacteroidetes bacterium]|nr:MAG: histidinol phosphatase [Bacteroidota bacterium]